MKYPTMSGFVGHNGDSVWLDPNGFPDNHPLVLANPHLFTSTPPPGVEAPAPEPTPEPTPPPRRGRPAKVEADKPKRAGGDDPAH